MMRSDRLNVIDPYKKELKLLNQNVFIILPISCQKMSSSMSFLPYVLDLMCHFTMGPGGPVWPGGPFKPCSP